MSYRALASLLSFPLLSACAAEGAMPRTLGSGDSAHGDGQTGGSGAGASQGGSGALAPDASDALDPTNTCAEDTFFAELEPSALMFQVDTSRSMNCKISEPSCLTDDPTGTPNDSRWDVFRGTLDDVLSSLPDSLAAGLMHFPNPNTGCAPTTPLVAIAPLSTSRAAIESQLSSLSPDYITPTHDAVLAALAQLRTRTESGRYLVLATDGAASVCEGCDASCANAGRVPESASNALVADVETALASEGIRTFVIGVPGSQNYRSVLSRLAVAGGTSLGSGCSENGPSYCHYDLTTAGVDFGSMLGMALSQIGESVLACVFDVPTDKEIDLGKVNVRLTDGGTVTNLKRDKAQTDGWNYVNGNKQIELFGPACEAAKKATQGKVDILYGCPTLEVI
jgi:hypothetical protein